MKNTLSINSQSFEMLSNLELGLARGSIWNNLYIPYKIENNYVNSAITPIEQVIYLITVYGFAIHELKLYIITHPDCKEAKETKAKIQGEYDKLCTYLESIKDRMIS